MRVFCLLVPEHLRVAEVRTVVVGNDRIARVGLEGHATIVAVGQTLLLVLSSAGIEGNDSILAEASCIVLVDDGRTRKDVSQLVAIECSLLLLPVQQVGRGSVTPAHITPVIAVRVVLIEEMPDTIDIDHAIRIVHPILCWRVVYLWTILLMI